MRTAAVIVMLFAAFLCLPVPANAVEYSYGITPYIGYHFFNDRFNDDRYPTDNYKDSFEGGLRAELTINSRWSAEAGLGYLKTELMSTGAKKNSTIYSINAVYNLLEGGKVVPYLTAGLEGDYTEGKALTGADAGIGVKIFLGDSLILKPEVRTIQLLRHREDAVVTLGLTFPFGGAVRAAPAARPAEPAPVPAPVPVAAADADKDGVPDSSDRCAETPSGATVDTNGCPADSDKDGVFDYRDKCPGTPRNSKVDADGCVLSITLKVNFDPGKSEVKQQYLDEIEGFAQFLKQYPDAKAEIQGHTDNMGDAKSNQELSEARASAVRDTLVSKFGIAAGRLTAKGYGEEKPVTGNDTPEGRETNRRVEAVIMK